MVKSYKKLYREIYSLKNLILAWKKARKGKTKKDYVINFEENLCSNLKILHDELKSEEYFPKPLKHFILRDPKTRKISKSHFRDRIVHHALCSIIEPIFDKTFIHDSCANRKGKGTSLALKRFEEFQRKVTHNFSKEAYCLRADVKHYFRKIDREILLQIIRRQISCRKTINLIKKILDNFEKGKGMPLGNLTSQFFANVYLNELDQFVKHKLKVKYYIRYVDDFVLLHSSKEQLESWKKEIEIFLKENLELELHPDKSKIISLSRGIDFVGFKIFYNFKIVKKRNRKNFIKRLKEIKKKYSLEEISKKELFDSIEGWIAYAVLGNSFELRKQLIREVNFLIEIRPGQDLNLRPNG